MRQRGLKVLVAAWVVSESFSQLRHRASATLGGVGGASPSTVPAGVATLLTVAVTPADSPPSTNILVSVNTSSIGGPPSSLLRDDGTNGDVTAGDNIFSARVTVRPAPLRYFANSIARDSRMTVTLIWPGYSSWSSISRAISCESRTAPSSSTSFGLTMTRISRPAWSA
jgi:hypothetical protein